MQYLRRCIHALTLAVFICTPLLAAASEHEAESEVLQQQVGALVEHVDRLAFDLRVTHGDTDVLPLSDTVINGIIADGVEWLKTAQKQSGDERGHFRYEYLPYTGEYLYDDNIVRQAGTFYQVGEIARHDSDDIHELEDVLIRSAEYFASISATGTLSGTEFRCILRHERSSICKLGATALALVGLLDLANAYPEHEATYRPLIRDYAAFIKAMKKTDGGFRNKYVTHREMQQTDESSYANGEAMLALVRYYRFVEDPEAREVLEDMFAYIDSDAVTFDSPLYLWAMAALRDMHELWPDPAHLAYAQRYTDWRVNGFQRRKLTDYNMCAYVEGIASAYLLLKDHMDAAERTALMEEIDFWLTKTRDLQIQRDEHFRVFENGDGSLTMRELAEPERAHGGFLTASDNPTQRIDYTQHCLNAYAILLTIHQI